MDSTTSIALVLLMAVFVLISIYYFRRQAKALEYVAEIDEARLMRQQQLWRREGAARLTVDNPLRWLTEQASAALGEPVALLQVQRALVSPLALEAAAEGGRRAVFSPLAPRALRRAAAGGKSRGKDTAARLGRRRSERGYSMAWWAMVMAFILAPLMSLVVDVTRLLLARADLQQAVDAACEAAALAGDTPYFNATGAQRIDAGLAASYAVQAFAAATVEAGARLVQPSLTAVSVVGPTEVACEATASLQPIIPVSPRLRVRVLAMSRMRFDQR